MTRFYICLIFIIHSTIVLNAQTVGYTNWEELYSDDKIRVQIQFYLPSLTTCQSSSGDKFKFKYRVIGKYREYPYFINWKLDFVDCQGAQFYKSYSLNVGAGARPYDITSMTVIESNDFQFEASKLGTKHYDAGASNIEKFGTGKKAPRNSTKPVEITGLKKVRINQPIQLSVSGGTLGLGAEWVWYDQFCGGKEIGRGGTLNFTSSNNVSVFVRAEGKNNTTDCITSLVEVDGSSLAPTSIEGMDKLCLGSSVTLKVKGGDLGLGGQWVWYSGSCGVKKLGVGTSLTVKPLQTSSYFVRAEGNLNITSCASKTVKVFDGSIAPVSIYTVSGKDKVCEGTTVSLKVEGGKLAADAKWVWYEGSCGSIKIGEGETISFIPKKTSVYSVKAEGFCPSPICLEKSITVVPLTPELTRIVAPSQVLKGEIITLSVPDWVTTPKLNIGWYESDCKEGKLLGYGSSIEVKPKKSIIYYAKGIGLCGSTKCISTTITPTKYYTIESVPDTTIMPWDNVVTTKAKNVVDNINFFEDLNLFEEMNFAMGAGADFRRFVANTQKRDMNQNKDVLFQHLLIGVGLYGELRFNPIYQNNFTLGIQLGGAIGKSPFDIDGFYRNINDVHLFEDYTYKGWNYAIEAAVGLKPIKILGSFQRHLQFNDYQAVLQNPGGTGHQITFNNTMLWETVGLGVRVGDQVNSESGVFLDLLYTFSKEQNNYDGNTDLRGTPFAQHGVSVDYWKNNNYALGLDIRLPMPFDKWKDFKLESATLQLNFKYNLVAFLNK